MKKYLCGLLALLMLCMCGCQAKDDGGKKDNAANYNQERYYAYVSDGKLQVADLWEGTVKEVDTGSRVSSVEAGICGDKSGEMLLQLNTGMYYWDGTSDKADYISQQAILIRISKDMKRVLYKTENGDLYLYSAGKGSEQLSKDVWRASLTENGDHIFFLKALDREDMSQIKSALYSCSPNGEEEKIAEIYGNASSAADHSAIAYRKTTKHVEGSLNYTFYLWTKINGEQKLPFDAFEIYVMDEDSIYYTTAKTSAYDGELYYYDGEKSVLLSETCGYCDKIGLDTLYSQNEEAWIYRDGKGVQVPIYHSLTKGAYSFIDNEKSFSGWGLTTRGTLYTVSLEKENFGEVLRQVEMGPYSIFKATITNGIVYHPGEYANEHKLVYGDESDCDTVGETDILQYVKDGKTYFYLNGEHILCANVPLAEGEESRVAYIDFTFQRKVFSVYFTEDGMHISNGKKITKISDKTADGFDEKPKGIMLTNWSQCDSASYCAYYVIDGVWSWNWQNGSGDYIIGS